jgi:hypothetical protein
LFMVNGPWAAERTNWYCCCVAGSCAAGTIAQLARLPQSSASSVVAAQIVADRLAG